MPRRELPELYDDLFEAIPVNSLLPLTTIADRAHMDTRLARRLLNLVIKLQGEAVVIEEIVGKKTAFRKETRAGRPRKTANR